MEASQSYGSTIVVRKKLGPADAQAIATPQTPEHGQPLELDGTAVREIPGWRRDRKVAVLDTARRVRIHTTDVVPHTITLAGRNSQNAPVIEEVRLRPGGGETSSFFDYWMITSAVPDDEEWNGTVVIGTNTVGSTAPQIMAHYQAIFAIGADVTVEGTATCQIECTREVPMALPQIYRDGYYITPPKVHWFVWPTLANITDEQVSDIDTPVNAWRLTVISGSDLCVARIVPIGLRT